jgi:hypothetical protein
MLSGLQDHSLPAAEMPEKGRPAFSGRRMCNVSGTSLKSFRYEFPLHLIQKESISKGGSRC